jgi:zinc/manganese transport system substrate-binding protein
LRCLLDAPRLARRLVHTLVLASLAGFAAPGSARAQEPLKVVASFSILGDLVSEVGRDHVAVTTLVGPGGDSHTFQPAPADAKAVAAARIVFVNGLGFEGWMPRLASAAGSKAPVVETAAGIEPRTMKEGGETVVDPHVWQSVANARVIVRHVRDALATADPAHAKDFEANASAYLRLLDGLEVEVVQAMAAIPPGRRRIITSHDAFDYFGAAYGLTLIAPQGVSTDTEASAKSVGAIIRQIRKENIPAVFIETISDPRLVERIATETGAKIGGTLYSDALSPPGAGAGTYIEMMRHNIRELAGALTS